MSDEIGKYQISNFPSQTHGGGIKKKIDSVGNDNTNKVNEIKPIYTPSTQSKLKSTISIHATTPTPQVGTPTSANTSVSTPAKQENTAANPLNQQSVPTEKIFNLGEVQKTVKEFAEKLPTSLAREILMSNLLEVRGKEQITLFVNHAEHENAIQQVKNELLGFLQQSFNNHQLQFQMRKPYTDSEKLNFLKSKYEQVNDLVNKLGLDLT